MHGSHYDTFTTALLKPTTLFIWDDSLYEAFKESKEVIVREIQKGPCTFDNTKPTCLAADWSNNGIGFWLFQMHCHCSYTKPFCRHQDWQITLVESRTTHAAEFQYAPIEGEAPAVADAKDKARFFVLGCEELIVPVDHKPLLKIFGNRSLDEISNTYLRNLKEKTLRYKFCIVRVPGVCHRAADAVSRHPTGNNPPDKLHLTNDIAAITHPALETQYPDITNIRHSFLAGQDARQKHFPRTQLTPLLLH